MVRKECSTIEREFLISALQGGIRLDERQFLDQRSLSFSISEDGSSVDCLLGSTRVMAHVSATITKPRPDRPFEGLFQVFSEINPIASHDYETGRSSEEELEISRMLDKSLTRARVVDREALCILAGQKVWSIRVDLLFLNDEGNLLDCASIAAMTALRNFRRPDVTLEGEDITIHSTQERIPVNLMLHHFPICLTFALFELPKTCIILDPSLLEERICSGKMTLAINTQKEICVVNKSGGVPLEVDEIMRLVKIASVKVREIDELIRKTVEKESIKFNLSALQDR
ncbi:ribosomal protein S5 domain 2-type protein [Phakopsora pachyrhizi]|uniref:Ribosomal protein S5 domain 2-type protein n=1 Tax=Phakopsora pachyrhizi TaxID=170000 RepID=A0AAV0APV0_PHAPC|nr:ribosomal protein S5 domain 2-type protein [Phakopsora pachyrhizi]KAI8453922.1 ribosomal protein S5 domain 2-type protein [Phakopsora pachyrhizi]CAH7669349.1 ribosomal protein S5 domain 2-type protein [Phakopsora pachyrhizi]